MPISKNNPEVLEWRVVNVTHMTQRAVYHVGGCVHSILCTDNGDNTFIDEVVNFHLPKSPNYWNDFKSIKFAFENNKSFRVFRKIGTNQWIYLGKRVVKSIDSNNVKKYIVEIVPK